MKGVVLAGGLGTRLYPLTKVTNKHLLPVYRKPMIYYPLETLRDAGIDDIMVVTGGNSSGDFLRLLGSGKDLGLRHLQYAYQEGEGGIAEALALAEGFAAGGPVCVVLGDNIFGSPIAPYAESFRKHPRGSRIVLKEVPDPHRFGVPELLGDRVIRIIEKPVEPPSPYAVTGIYFYDERVFDIIRSLERSSRGEMEITDVNNQYIEWREMTFDVLDGWWTDAGTIESLHRAANLLADKEEGEKTAGEPKLTNVTTG